MDGGCSDQLYLFFLNFGVDSFQATMCLSLSSALSLLTHSRGGQHSYAVARRCESGGFLGQPQAFAPLEKLDFLDILKDLHYENDETELWLTLPHAMDITGLLRNAEGSSFAFGNFLQT